MSSRKSKLNKGMAFTILLIAMFIIATFPFNIDWTEFSQRNDIQIPLWFFYLIFGLDFISLVSLVLIYFYKKIGVFLFPLATMVHFVLHNYYLSTFLYFDVLLLFIYVLLLLIVIPRWDSF